MTSLRVSADRRHLARADGTPFFYLADTAWELLNRATREETDDYLRDRAAKRFTVIQTTALSELSGTAMCNAAGDPALLDGDPQRPNEPYWQHVDRVVHRANELGLCVGLVPAWGDKWNRRKAPGPEIFTPERALSFGRWLGRRFRSADLLWIVGGDRPVEDDTHRAIVTALATGLREGDAGTHLLTFHPPGASSSWRVWGDAPWIDFHLAQSAHCGHDVPNWILIEEMWQAAPPRPCLDGEPPYEEHPVMTPAWEQTGDRFDAYEVRKAAYRAVFSGAGGHAYGAHPVWQWASPRHPPINGVRSGWRDALQLPGATQMQHLRRLAELYPFAQRIPAQELVAPTLTGRHDHHCACRSADGSWALVYLPTGWPVTVHMHSLPAARWRAAWFDPRCGAFSSTGAFVQPPAVVATPPVRGLDWILCLDAR